ncbi:hypothetical protein D9M68_813620 [compost metagenome]
MAYFRHANLHAMNGRQTYMTRYPLDFGHGDPRPHFPWFHKDNAPVDDRVKAAA